MNNFFTVFGLWLLLVGVLPAELSAQTTSDRPDVIYKTDNTTIQAIINEVTDTEVIYRRASNPTGPLFRTRRLDIRSVRYANGETDEFVKQTGAEASRPDPARSPYEPLKPTRYEPRPRYEQAGRRPSSPGYAFERGHPVLSVGAMLPSQITPLTASVEFAATNDLGIGARIWYWSKDGLSDVTVQAMVNYHLARVLNAQNAKADPYVGLSIGKTFPSYKGGESGNIGANLQIGLRYLLSEKVGPYAQLGLGIVNVDESFVYGNSSAVFELGIAVKVGR
ncbi:hypothetical protein FAES_3823 [Fibrella aestuarina BUZ 2]|uniref:Secreted protein n=1 Tax=Fibrella aestuarina BUZ 2 TaxID=1166018 RepID=I0KCH7_9BACT|nr:hypothetical protein [Fibrella aestuarina]CCH01830.1 hypothetical protein FAES_3823 [Fibrella aestuarina BUZ 2]